MARKSRKNVKEIKFTTNKEIYNVGIYLRISVLDKEDIDTIENQKNIILDYVKDKEEFNLVEIYEDSNKTGTNFDRSDFKNLLEDIKASKINCIIVKDLSRFGRNYIECGNYLEKIFPFMNIRFIAINDNYDSKNENSSEILIMHLKNIVNEIYAKDISKKVSTVFREKQKRGEFIGTWASYGYLKSPNNKNKLIINTEISYIIKEIFDLRLKGYSYNKIAIFLNEKNILSPYAYLYSKGFIKNDRFKDTKWLETTVKKILSNEIYIGNLVQRKYKTISNKKREKNNVEDYIIVENTHKPIISKEIFYKVQEINEKSKQIYYSRNKKTKFRENILKKYIKCGECGKNLIKRQKERKENSKVYSFFECKYHRLNNCKFTIIKSNYIEELVFNEIKNQIEVNINLQNILNKNIISLEENILNNKIKDIEKEIRKIKNFYKIIYEDYINKILLEEEYIFNKNSYLEKEKVLLEKKELLEIELKNIKNNLSMQNKCLIEFFEFKNKNILTRELIKILIKEIIIFKDKTIKIYFNYKN